MTLTDTAKPRLTFPIMQPDDLAVMAKWLRMPHVQQFWSPAPDTAKALHDKYFGDASQEPGLRRCIIRAENQPIGFIQRYKVTGADHPYWPFLPDACLALKIPPVDRAMGLDLFIAEPSALGIGLAVPIIRKFTAKHCAEAPLLVIDPELSNTKAIHVYTRAGFRPVMQFDGMPPHMKPVPHQFMAALGPALG
ncbi:MAG: GNAT family N-acetyltransferase [Alphaproteobacteria bacterium]